MKRYEAYKDSGVRWIGEIPSHWEPHRNKDIFTESKKVVGEDSSLYTLLSLTKQGVIIRDLSEGKGKFPKDFDSYKVVEPNDIIFCLFDVDETPRTVGLSDHHGMITGAYDIFKTRRVLPRYVLYYYLSIDERKALRPLYKGLRKVVPMQSFMSAKIFLPPLEEQQAIADYLKDKTSKIEQYIAQREKEVELLGELKQSEIANVVTKGLNPDVPMKDSGIPWIGEIPAHWEVKRIKSFLSESKEKTTDNDGVLLSLSQYTGISLKSEANKVGMFEAETTEGYNVVHKGQFVMNIMLAWNGSYAVSELDGVISPAYCVFNFKQGICKKYFHYLWRTQAYQGAFKTMSKGIIDSRLRLYPMYFLAFKSIIPPLSEQQAIVNYIDTRIAKIDQHITGLTAEIEYLKEFKQRLISDAVTGQIKVTD